jgi:hypothetical protein
MLVIASGRRRDHNGSDEQSGTHAMHPGTVIVRRWVLFGNAIERRRLVAEVGTNVLI